VIIAFTWRLTSTRLWIMSQRRWNLNAIHSRPPRTLRDCSTDRCGGKIMTISGPSEHVKAHRGARGDNGGLAATLPLKAW
jgi:hypothetical protein